MKLYQSSVLFFLCSMLMVPAWANTPRDPYKYFFNESWNDFREELQIAKNENKQGIMFFFEQDECPFCHRMKNTVLNQPEVQEYFRKHFRLIAVDIEGDIEVTDFAGNTTTQKEFTQQSNRVRATPVFAFYDLEGNRITRYTGATNGPEEFLWLGEYVISGAYKSKSFVSYKRQKRTQQQ